MGLGAYLIFILAFAHPLLLWAQDLTPECANKILMAEQSCAGANYKVSSMAEFAGSVQGCAGKVVECYQACGDAGNTFIDGSNPYVALGKVTKFIHKNTAIVKPAMKNCRNAAKPFVQAMTSNCSNPQFTGIKSTFAGDPASRSTNTELIELCLNSSADTVAKFDKDTFDTTAPGPIPPQIGITQDPGDLGKITITAHDPCMVNFIAKAGANQTNATDAMSAIGGQCKQKVCSDGVHQQKPYCTAAVDPGDKKPQTPKDDPKNEQVNKSDYDKLKKLADDLAKKQKEAAGGGGGGMGGGGGGSGGGGGGSGFGGGGSGGNSDGGVNLANYDSKGGEMPKMVEVSSVSGRANLEQDRLSRAIHAGKGATKSEAKGKTAGDSDRQSPSLGGGGLGGGNIANNSGNSNGGRASPGIGNRGRAFGKERDNLGGHSYMGSGGSPGTPIAAGENEYRPSGGVRNVSNNYQEGGYGGTGGMEGKFRNLLKGHEFSHGKPEFGSSDSDFFRLQNSLFEQIVLDGMLDENGNEI